MKRNKDQFPLRGSSRRDFIKGVVSASAVLGLGPVRALEVLEQVGGSALADEACSPAARSVNIVAGNGGLPWFTLLWPVPMVVEQKQASFSFDDYSKVGQVGGTMPGHPLYARLVDGKPLFARFGPKKGVSAVMTGRDETHTLTPTTNNVIAGGVGGGVQVFAGSAAMQGTLQTLVPVISVKRGGAVMPYGRAQGAPPPAVVSGADEMVGLFSSAASKLADRLADPDNRALFDEFYKAFLGLSRTASRPTYARAYRDANVAAELLSQNLGEQLKPDPKKLAAWCPGFDVLGTDRDNKVVELAKMLLVTSNAFQRGLTGQVVIPAFNDDPHGAFDPANLARTTKTADGLARVLQSFLDDLDAVEEPLCSGKGKKLSDNVVMTFSGDTTKNPFIRSGWPDGSPGNANWMYVMSNGYMKPGWFGQVTTAGRTNFMPATGELNAGVPEPACTSASLAAVLFSVSKGNDRLVRNFFTGDYQGLIVPQNG